LAVFITCENVVTAVELPAFRRRPKAALRIVQGKRAGSCEHFSRGDNKISKKQAEVERDKFLAKLSHAASLWL